jgi:hypothetical protein
MTFELRALMVNAVPEADVAVELQRCGPEMQAGPKSPRPPQRPKPGPVCLPLTTNPFTPARIELAPLAALRGQLRQALRA